MHGVLLKAAESQHARPLPKGSSANSWSSYLLLKDEEEPDCHEDQFLWYGPQMGPDITTVGSTWAGRHLPTPGIFHFGVRRH